MGREGLKNSTLGRIWRRFWNCRVTHNGIYAPNIVAIIIIVATGVVCAVFPYKALKQSEEQVMLDTITGEVKDIVFSFSTLYKDSITELLFYQSIITTLGFTNRTYKQQDSLMVYDYLNHIHKDFSFSVIGAVALAVRLDQNNDTWVEGEEQYSIVFVSDFDNGLDAENTLLELDLTNIPYMYTLINESIATGEWVEGLATIPLPVFTPEQQGDIIFFPIYDNLITPGAQLDRQNSAVGVMIGLFDVHTLVQFIMENNDVSEFRLYLYDTRLPASRNFIFPLNSEYQSLAEIPSQWDIIVRQIPGTNWTLAVIPNDSFIGGRIYTAIATVIVVSTTTVLSIIFLLHQIFHRETKRRLHAEKQALLKTILPEQISDKLVQRQNGEIGSEYEVIAENRENACVMFMDIAGFTDFSSRVSAVSVVSMLNRLFSKIDELCVKHQIEKIKTIGDCYMAANGIFNNLHDIKPNITHMLDFVLEVRSVAQQTFEADELTNHLKVRIGVHTGPIIAGVICIANKPHFDIWGDTVNVASRMESTGIPKSIQVSEAVYTAAAAITPPIFVFESREGLVHVKGKGEMATYFLVGRISSV